MVPAALAGPLLSPRQFKQKRAALTYEALLDAAARVFAERGFEAAQTPDIAAAAGVSTGAFYRYFADKRQAFVEMIARHLERTYDEVLAELRPERFVGAEVPAALDVALGVLFESLRRDVQLNRVYLHRSLCDPEVESLRTRFEARGRASLAALIRQIVPASVVADADAAALVIQVAVLEVASETVGLRPSAQPVDEPGSGEAPGAAEQRVKRVLREMIERYLFPAGIAPPAAEPQPPPRRRRTATPG